MRNRSSISWTRWSLLLSILFLLAERAYTQTSGCSSTWNEIALRESLIADTSMRRTYTLCPNKTHEVGVYNVDKEITEGQRALPLDANMTIQCGYSGSRSEGCVVTGGDLQLDGTDMYEAGSGSLDNVIIQGIVFSGVLGYAARFNRPGNVLFLDCEFRDMNDTYTAILLDYFDAGNSGTELTVTFSNCVFDNNTHAGWPSQPALVVGNGRQNRIIIEKTRFTNNDMITNNLMNATDSFLVESAGPLTVRGSCFENNQISVSPISIYHTEYFFASNYQYLSYGPVCSFASHFETREQVETFTPRCSDFDVVGGGAVCPIDGTSSPTPVPSSSPTNPTASPTLSPTETLPSPSAQPSTTTQPSSGPTYWPTPGPTAGPTSSVVPTFLNFTVSPTSSPMSSRADVATEAPVLALGPSGVTIKSTDPPTTTGVTIKEPTTTGVTVKGPTTTAAIESSARQFASCAIVMMMSLVALLALL